MFKIFRNPRISGVEIQKLAKVHDTLCEAITVINQIYSTFMMLYFAGIFCVFNLFLFSLVITKNYYSNPNEALIVNIGNFQWNFYDLFLIFIVIRSTTAASDEGKETSSLIFKIINTSMDGKLNGRVCLPTISSNSTYFKLLLSVSSWAFPNK